MHLQGLSVAKFLPNKKKSWSIKLTDSSKPLNPKLEL